MKERDRERERERERDRQRERERERERDVLTTKQGSAHKLDYFHIKKDLKVFTKSAFCQP